MYPASEILDEIIHWLELQVYDSSFEPSVVTDWETALKYMRNDDKDRFDAEPWEHDLYRLGWIHDRKHGIVILNLYGNHDLWCQGLYALAHMDQYKKGRLTSFNGIDLKDEFILSGQGISLHVGCNTTVFISKDYPPTSKERMLLEEFDPRCIMALRRNPRK